MAKGGKRAGAGRPKGSRNVNMTNVVARSLAAYGGDGKTMDVFFTKMLTVAMDDNHSNQSVAMKIIADKTAPTLKSVEVDQTVTGSVGIEGIDIHMIKPKPSK